MNKDDIRRLLRTYQPSDSAESDALTATCAVVEKTERPWSRQELGGHLTAAAWIMSPDFSRVLFVLHAKLGLWLPPGGHIDDEDASLAAAALREAREETGLRSLRLVQDEIFDLDRHPIPEHGGVSEHWHYDSRFLVVADDTESLTCSPESYALKWFTLDEVLEANPQASHQRMVRKTKALR